MDPLVDCCRWPPLPEPYLQALRDAVHFILAHFTVTGIVASGTVLRGAPDAASDLDLVVIHTRPMRQRLQKRFNAIPAEIFVNPPAAFDAYFAREQTGGRPIMAHMLATGTPILALDGTVATLQTRARQLLGSPPAISLEQITRARYTAATRYEDALDVVARDPTMASMLLVQAVIDMLHFLFWQAHRFVPRAKELMQAVRAEDAETARLVERLFACTALEERLQVARAIADRTIGVHGFFEWESHPEPVA